MRPISPNALRRMTALAAGLTAAALTLSAAATDRRYQNRLTPIAEPAPLLADFPEFVAPIPETARFEAPPLIDEEGADLSVRAWRFSYNARGVVEVPNRLRSDRTAVIIVHPWGIDDGQGWTTPEPAGAAFYCTPEKNRLVGQHARSALNPFLRSLRDRAAFVMYSLPGREDSIRRKLYRSFRGAPTAEERRQGREELSDALADFAYEGEPLPAEITLSADRPAADYFRQLPSLDAGDQYNAPGFWALPIPVHQEVDLDPQDVVIYDGDGYPALRDFLREQGIRHVLLGGYATDMCVCATTAGYDNLKQDFNVFLVGDMTLATFPASPTPAHATNAAVCLASMKVLITQASWIQPRDGNEP